MLRLDDGRVEYSVVAQDNVLFDFDLQEDGKIAWLEAGYLHDSVSADGTLYWASAQEPRPHVLAMGVAAGARRNGVSTGMLRVRLGK